ncbi:MAG TPA: CapA family protein [Ktedonobacterales bacterium]|nr:CapA family protein [Ktedonobacterales bacterium]
MGEDGSRGPGGQDGRPPGPAGTADATTAPKHTRRALLAGLGAAGLAGLGAAGLGAARVFGVGATTTRALGHLAPTPTMIPTATPDLRPASVVITGDVMLARTVTQRILATSDNFPFEHTANFLRDFDLTVGNLECVVSTLGSPVPKAFDLEATPAGFQRLQDAGFSLVSVANNHSGDYGKDAFVDMLNHLKTNTIAWTGGGLNYAEAHQAKIVRIRQTVIGFLAYCGVEYFSYAATATTPGHAWLDPNAMHADIVAARPLCDFLIVFNHWGQEYQTVQNQDQTNLAHLAIDSGADLVVGCHPHVIQPSETYNGKPIIYSLGNFVFDYMTDPLTSAGHVLTLRIQGSKLLDWKLVNIELGDWGQPALV